MLSNYLKIARRNLMRRKAYTAINVFGLGIGITSAILLFLLVKFHLSFDNFHRDTNRIYRIVTEFHRESVRYSPSVPGTLGKAFRNDYTFSEKVANIATYHDEVIAIADNGAIKKFKESEGIAFADPEFFEIFNFPLLQGNKATALTAPNTAIITEQIAQKYFGSTSPLNKTFRVNKIDFRITGILRDMPANSDRQTEIYASYATLRQYDSWLAGDSAWSGVSSVMQTYVRLRPGVSVEQVEAVFPAYVKTYRPKNKNVHHYKLQPLADVHFSQRYEGKMPKPILWAMSLIGLLLIVTACVNFVNLATAQAFRRSREVGVRKVLGSVRSQLFRQFITETGLITVLAVVLALICAVSILPFINNLFQTHITISLADWRLGVFLLLIIPVVTFFSGAYPGLMLSRLQPVLALKGRTSAKGGSGFNTRRTLIIAQFVISQILIIGVVIMAHQMRYTTQADLGFNKNAVIMLPIGPGPEKAKTLKEQFSRLAGVQQVSLCRSAPLSDNNWITNFRYDTRNEEENFAINMRSADAQYVPLFELELVAGRNIQPADSAREFIVNETLAKKLGIRPDSILGHMLTVQGGTIKAPIVGVVKDFHDRSFHENIQPIGIASISDDYDYFGVKINLANMTSVIPALEKTWSDMYPDQVVEYSFLDDQIRELYQPVMLLLRLLETFAAIAVFIGCLGLYGMVSFMAAQKTKEIGIRKVLGSSVTQIIWIFAKEFSRLILIAFAVAVPLAWFVMHRWLDNFAYQVKIGPGIFILAIVLTFAIAMLTVGYQSVKAALVNPVKSLRAD